MVHGDGRKYLTALVDVDDGVARARLSAAGVSPGPAPRAHPLVRQWIQARVDAVNADLAPYETIKKFCIAEEPLTMAGGLLTPSLKVKRAQVYARYGEALDALYDG